jgi:tetratricopeptide (TPR) repeat protein
MNSSEHPLVFARKQLDEAERLRRSGKHASAKKLCQHLIDQHPDYFGALHTLGLILADMGDLKGALGALTQAHAYFPQGAQTVVALGTVYLQLGTRDLAIECIQKALQLGGGDAPMQVTLGKILDEEKDYDRACEAYRKAIQLEPEWREPQLLLAFCYENLGDREASLKILMDRIEKGDHSLSVLAGLLQLPPSSSDQLLHDLFSKVAVDESESRYLFARAQIRHRVGDVEGAWRDLTLVNQKKAKELAQQRAQNRVWQGQSLRYATQFAAAAVADDPEYPQPLFILGPSRSGKTSVEALIAQGSLVDRGFENSIPVQVARKAFRKAGYPTSFQWPLLPRPLEEFVRTEFRNLLLARSSSAQVFTNTSPSRIHDIIRIFSIVPNAKALFVRRDANDLAFRIFGKNYASGNFYAYDLEDIFDHIKWYNQMIDAICEKYPDKCAIVNYEAVVGDPNLAVRAARQLCGDLGSVPAVTHMASDVGCSKPYRNLMQSSS